MKDTDFFKKNLIAWTLVAGVALAGCGNGDTDMRDDGLGNDDVGDEIEDVGQGIETQAQELGQRMAAPFSQLDTDTNDQVTQEEFQSYARQRGLFERWDVNRDQQIGQDEFNAIGFDQGVGDFEAWDEDDSGSLSNDELHSGLYRAYDENEDGHWDSGDWDDAGEAGFWDF